tara:strand:- start:20 stop:187 length:168 start_codon:yes stop_codon:yes gene_type:complete
MKMKEENKYQYQGKRKDQVEFSLKAVMGALVGMIAIMLFSLVAVVAVEVWSWLCG